ncbi:MAG: acyl-homoserine-lactone synthase [Sulfurovum sp.]
MLSEKVFRLLTEEYTIVLATTKSHFDIVKDIRREVFSKKYNISSKLLDEKGYLFDKSDEQSFIYLLQHIKTKKYVGTVRNFFVNKLTPYKELPMQKKSYIKDIEELTQSLPICEISRLALSNTIMEHKDFSGLRLRINLSLLLMVATRVNFFLYKYKYIFAIMEVSLDRLLKRQGVKFKQVGEAVEYYGSCIPFSIKREELLIDSQESMDSFTKFYLNKLHQDPKEFWEFIDSNPYLSREDIEFDDLSKMINV